MTPRVAQDWERNVHKLQDPITSKVMLKDGKAPKGGWPSTLLVRLHGFPELERFQAKAGKDALDCEVNRVEGGSALHRCSAHD